MSVVVQESAAHAQHETNQYHKILQTVSWDR